MTGFHTVRRAGKTTLQIRNAPQGAIFVWVNGHIEYPKAIARELGREDLDFKPLSWFRMENIAGRSGVKIVLDHAVHNNPFRSKTAIEWAEWRGLLAVEVEAQA